MTTDILETRRRLLRLVERFPGLHLRELAREAETTEALAGYHLDALVADGLAKDVQDSGFRRFYPAAGGPTSESDREILGFLRQVVPLQIAVHLLGARTATNQDLAERVKLAKSTISYHVSKLQAAGIVQPASDGAGFELRDPKRIERLLLRWHPPRDLTDRFQGVWQRYYANLRRRR